jgi:alpha-glucosidase (family GH31 glycosyl hydrolase)
MLLSVAAVSAASAQKPVVLANGLALTVQPATDDQPHAVRITVGPTTGDAASPSPSDRQRIGQVEVRFDRGSQGLRLRDPQGRSWTGRFTPLSGFGRAQTTGLEIAWKARPSEALYGLGERFDHLDVAGQEVEMWIVDEPGQGDGSASYFVTPVLYSSAGYGLFADDNPEGVFDLNRGGDGWHRYRRAGASASFVVSFGEDVPELVRQRTERIGGLVPAPAWGYRPWISKNSYETQAEAEAAIDGMQSRDLPFGVIVLEAWKGHSESGDFNRFSTERWPDAQGFLDRCAREGIKVVLWQVPILHPSSPWFAEAKQKGYLVRDAAGGVSLREEWLAGFGNIDFENPDAVAFWKDMLRPVVRMGVAGFKADDGEAIKPHDRLGPQRDIPGWQAHNHYSTLYNQATYDVLQEEGVDGMLWARSGSLGIEKSPGLWAGDQGAEWSQLQRLITAGLSSSLSGMPYWSHDIGGYYGEATPELYIRWLQFGALSPFMQFHGINPREPWHFGDEAVEAYRRLARLRQRLLPELIHLGDEAAASGMPIMRPMFFLTGDHADARLDQYTLGEHLLVAPVKEEGAVGRAVQFPEGRWLHAFSPLAFDGPGTFRVPVGLVDAPLFIRQGATLRVAGEPGRPLNQRADADEVSEWTITPETMWGQTPVLSDLQVPLRGDPKGQTTELTFRVDGTTIDRLQVRWWFEDTPQQKTDAAVEAVGDGGARVDLTPTDFTQAVGRRQHYEVVASVGSSPQTLLSGVVDWNDLVRVSIRDPYLDVVGSGPATISAELQNRTAVACTVVPTLDVPDGVSLESRVGSVRLEPGETTVVEWSTEVSAAPDQVGDRRVQAVARVQGVVLDRAEAALIQSPRWLVAGPFPAESKTYGFGATTAAEWSFGPEHTFPTAAGDVRWETVDPDAVQAMDGLDFNQLFGETTNAFVYAMAVVHSDRQQDVQVRAGSDDTLSLWVNDDMLIAEEYDRPALPDQNILDATLQPGLNRILVKVAQGSGGWGLVLRLTDPQGRPLQGVTDGLKDVEAYAADRPAQGQAARSDFDLDWQRLGPFPWDRDQGAPGLETLERAIEAGQRLPRRVEGHRWQPLERPDDAGPIDLKPISRDDWVYAYASTRFELDQPTALMIRAGSDDGLVLWVNQQRVIDAERPREFKPGEDQATVRLGPGQHRVVARISQNQADWKFDVRLFKRPAD